MQSLLLLSGLLCDETIWSDVARRLTDRADVRIINFPDFKSIMDMAEHVLQGAPDSFALAGHSMGGRVALEVLRRAPSRVTRIALLNTGVHPRRDAEFESRGRLVTLARERGMAALAAEWLPPMMGASASRVAEVMPSLTAMVERQTAQSFASQTVAMLERPEAASILPTIAVPTLLLSGTADRWSPLAQHAEMQRQSRRATLVAVEDAGHMAPIEQPAAVATALAEWLRAAPAAMPQRVSPVDAN
jgi:pimeloyl-ACP methyl ester carboxylesterase